VYAVPSPTVFDLTGHPPPSAKNWVAEHISLFTTPGA
jgi:NAD(P)H dehydrogenase (quinone)